MLTLMLDGLVVSATSWTFLVRPRTLPSASNASGWRRHPGSWLLVVVAMVLVNQVLFTVYVDRVWHGDVSRLSRHLGAGWLHLAELGWLADRWPRPELLAWTVLRAQAFLELPFVLLTYLLVARWTGAAVFRQVVAVRWPLAIAWTAAFCLAEWSFRSPWTDLDLVVRVVACLVVTPLIGRLSGGEAVTPALLPLLGSAGALGVLVLATYDTVLLYDLGDVDDWAGRVLVAGGALVAARCWALRSRSSSGPAVGAVVSSLAAFIVVFAVPSLPIRYGLNVASPVVALVAASMVCLHALRLGWPRDRLALLAPTTLAASVGGLTGVLATHGFREVRELGAICGLVLGALLACSVADVRTARRTGRRSR